MDSLFDDPAFVAALEQLDLPAQNPDPGEFGHRRTLVEWATEEGLILDPPDDVFVPVAASGGLRALSAFAFVALMFVGAAAAAVVFHAPLSRILSAL
jgi:hypothetical protein